MLLMDAGIEYLGHRPQHAKYEQDADKRWQVGDGLEYRYEDESAHAEEEDNLALSGRQAVALFNDCCLLNGHEVTIQRQRQEIGRNDHRHQRGNENLHDDAGSCDDAFVPQHDGGYVADGRECTAGVGSNDYQGGIDEAVLLVGN